MKKGNKIILFLVCFLTLTFSVFGQRYAYIDSDYIMDQIPEYHQAQKELDKLANQWQQEITDRYQQIENKKTELIRVSAILPQEERERREEEIKQLESDAMEMQQLRFGVNGDLFAKRKELIEPIQDRVFEALGEVASSRNFAFVFDKANQSNLIFADPKFDISQMVLRKMGINIR